MALTLELPPALAAELDAIAIREGTTVEQHAVVLLRLAHAIFDVPFADEPRSLQERYKGLLLDSGQTRDALREFAKKADKKEPRLSILGKYAHLPSGSEEYAREKQEELAREEAKFR